MEDISKTCKYCNIEKTIYDFEKNRNKCKQCRREYKHVYKKEYRIKNITHIRQSSKEYYIKKKNKIDEYNLKYYYENINKEKKRRKLYSLKNREKLTNYRRIYREKNREKINEYAVKRRESNISIKILANLRSRLISVINRKNTIKRDKTIKLIGCSSIYLKSYLESKFLPTMTWENYGKYWHIDHIIPCSSFDLTKKEEQQKCFHYTNLQPLFSKTIIIDGIEYIGNLNKGSKMLI